jgi:hypothetical protein
MTRRLGVFVAALACSLTLSACGGGESGSSGGAATTPAKGDQSQMSVAAGDFGVPECDDYMKKYIACVDSKVPDAARPAMKQSLDQVKAAWKQAASTPTGKAGLAAACTQALGVAKQSFAAYGCSW